MSGHAAALGAHEERWLLERLGDRPWRDGLASTFAATRPGLYAQLVDPGQAAALALVDIAPGQRCLDATAGWGQLAIPLAARARVTVLAPSATRAAILARMAAQEGVGLELAVGALAECPIAPSTFDLLLLHALPGGAGAAAEWDATLAAMRHVAALLRHRGTLYLAAANDLALDQLSGGDNGGWTLARYAELFAQAGLIRTAGYACFPDHERPRYFVPLDLVEDFVRGMPPLAWHDAGAAHRLDATYAELAAEGIAHHFAPSFAFVLRREDPS
jgi:SAM-dependent methyltransferase